MEDTKLRGMKRGRFSEKKIQILLTIKNKMIKMIVVIHERNIKEQS